MSITCHLWCQSFSLWSSDEDRVSNMNSMTDSASSWSLLCAGVCGCRTRDTCCPMFVCVLCLSWMGCSELLYCTVIYCTVLYYTLQYSILLYIVVLYSILLYSTILYAILFYSTLFYWIQHFSTLLLYSTLLYFTLFYFILFYSMIFYSSRLVSVPWILPNGNGF